MLKELHLAGCSSLVEVHPSISALRNLVFLNLKGCIELKMLPSKIDMRSLQLLDLSQCSNLEKFPEVSEVMKELSRIYLDGTAIKELPSSINNLSGLSTLSLIGCKELKSLPSSVHMGSLELLDLSDCSNLQNCPEVSECMKELTWLYLDGTAVKELPSSIYNLTRLHTLRLIGCNELKSLPCRIHMKSLVFLHLSDCSNLETFPEIAENMEGLSELYLDGTAIRELPSTIGRLHGLRVLSMRNCRTLVCLPDSICNMACLKELGCSKLTKIPHPLGNLDKLEITGSGINPLAFPFFELDKISRPTMNWPRKDGSFFADIGEMGSTRTRDEQMEGVRVLGEEEPSNLGARSTWQQLWPVSDRLREKQNEKQTMDEVEECSGGPICLCFSLFGCTMSSIKNQRKGETEPGEVS